MHCECLRLADRPPGKTEEDVFFFFWEKKSWIDGAGLAPMLLWTEWVSGGKRSTCVSPGGSVRMGQDGTSCLSCLAPRPGGGSPKLLRPWVRPEKEKVEASSGHVTQGPKLPPGRCMTGAFFGVFGAATKCAMCYVAWFIIFLQATKLICSPIV